MQDIILREATAEDINDLFLLFQQLQPRERLDKKTIESFFKEMLNSDKHNAWVAVKNGKVVGYTDVVFRTYHFAFGWTARIETTIVDESMRRQGIATALIKKCEEEAKKCGCKIIELDSGTQRVDAHKFYEKNGYSKRGYLFWKHL